MSPRSSQQAARANRSAIVKRAVAVAAEEGVQAITLGRLARDVGMSKAGVIGHFGTMEALELEAVATAIERFTAAVWEPAAEKRAGLDRLSCICDRWLAYIASKSYVGGCLTSAEHSTSPLVRAAVAQAMGRWRRQLVTDARAAVDAGDLAAGTDPQDVAFQISGAALAAAQSLRLGLDPKVRRHARRAMGRALGR